MHQNLENLSLQNWSHVISFIVIVSLLPGCCSLPVFFLPIKGSLFWLFLRAMTWIVYSVPGSRPGGRTEHPIMSVGSASEVEIDLTRRHYWGVSMLSPAGRWPLER